MEASKSLAIYKTYPEEEIKTYKELEKSLSKCVRTKKETDETISDKIDNIVLNPVLAYPIFIGFLYTLFKFTFDWVGGPLQELSAGAIETYIQAPASEMMANSSGWFNSLIVDGIIGGLGGALPFFPLFEPLGFGDWRAGVAILTGLSAKEIVVATMEILYGDLNTVLPTLFTSVTAYGF